MCVIRYFEVGNLALTDDALKARNNSKYLNSANDDKSGIGSV